MCSVCACTSLKSKVQIFDNLTRDSKSPVATKRHPHSPAEVDREKRAELGPTQNILGNRTDTKYLKLKYKNISVYFFFLNIPSLGGPRSDHLIVNRMGRGGGGVAIPNYHLFSRDFKYANSE